MRSRKLKAEAEAVHSRETSSWRLGTLTRSQLVRGLAQAFLDDELLTRAAALSYYFIFALFPLILSLLAVLGLFAQSTDFRAGLIRQFGRLMPPSALSLVDTTISEISVHSSRWKLAFGILLALWSGSGGVSCIMDALDRSHRVRESRPFWKRQLTSFALTSALSGLVLAALAIVLAGDSLAEFVGGLTGLSRATLTVWQFAEWPIALLFALFSLALLYHFGPDTRQRWRWITPGSVAGVLMWVLASLLFREYVFFFSSYSRSYGSLAAVMVLLLWLYITGLAILLGGAIDAEIARRGPRPQSEPRVSK